MQFSTRLCPKTLILLRLSSHSARYWMSVVQRLFPAKCLEPSIRWTYWHTRYGSTIEMTQQWACSAVYECDMTMRTFIDLANPYSQTLITMQVSEIPDTAGLLDSGVCSSFFACELSLDAVFETNYHQCSHRAAMQCLIHS